jgi:hypothetical protein
VFPKNSRVAQKGRSGNQTRGSGVHGTIFSFILQTRLIMEEGKFNRMSLAERSNIVWQKGKFVDSVICNNYCLMLYSVERQFVELFLDLKSHSIVWISLANDHDLAKYLADVRIEVLNSPGTA